MDFGGIFVMDIMLFCLVEFVDVDKGDIRGVLLFSFFISFYVLIILVLLDLEGFICFRSEDLGLVWFFLICFDLNFE